tara:strand:- start:811 stop:1293 length:483 start_codon:yes stop_codon:yes gene_type:complete
MPACADTTIHGVGVIPSQLMNAMPNPLIQKSAQADFNDGAAAISQGADFDNLPRSIALVNNDPSIQRHPQSNMTPVCVKQDWNKVSHFVDMLGATPYDRSTTRSSKLEHSKMNESLRLSQKTRSDGLAQEPLVRDSTGPAEITTQSVPWIKCAPGCPDKK